MESIEIRNFGPIRHVVIPNISSIVVLIGESGSGKSTILKVVSLFRWVFKMMNIGSFLKHSNFGKLPFHILFEQLLETDGLQEYIHNDSFLQYSNGSCVLTWKKGRALKGHTKRIPKEDLSLEKISFITDMRSLIHDVDNRQVRGLRLPFYLNETFYDYLLARESVNELKVLNLGVEYRRVKRNKGYEDYIFNATNAPSVALKAASSGMKNAVPLNVIVKYYADHYNFIKAFNAAILRYVTDQDGLSSFKPVTDIGGIAKRNVHLMIEEPELSLFPSSQTALVDFLVEHICTHAKNRSHAMTLMMATHSPYIVNYLNVLVRKPVDEGGIDGNDIGVYFVNEGMIFNLLETDVHTGRRYINSEALSQEMVRIANQYRSL